MRLCCNCFEKLLDREIVCPICDSNITLDNNQTKQFYCLLNDVRKAGEFRKRFLKKNSKYELVFRYIEYREEHPINNNCNKPEVLGFANNKISNESHEEYWKRINEHTINKPNSTKLMVECPYCHSTNTKKISNLSKAGSVALFGIFALEKTSKQWHCNHCNSDF